VIHVRGQFWGTRRSAALRIGLGVLGAFDAWVGGWALIFPSSFYADFPGLGMHWVAAAPPYNEHLLTDFGTALLGIAVALGLAAVVAERRVVQVVLLTALVQAAPHLIFHLAHADALGGGQVLLSRSSLAVPFVLALGLLWLTRHPDHSVMAAETVGRSTALGSSR